eukprot:PITA_18207
MTPYEAVYGQLPPSLVSYILISSKVQPVDQLLHNGAPMIAHLKDNLHQAHNQMKQQANKHCSERSFQVLQHIGVVAYKLALSTTSKIHSVFHVSCHKKVMGNNCRVQTSPPKLDEEGSLGLRPEQVLDTRERHLRGCMIKDVLIKWKDISPEDAT